MNACSDSLGSATSAKVLAVVVSYRGGSKVADTVRALVNQVGRVLVVDNGSDSASLELLRSLQAQGLATLLELGANKGLGFALNVGARKALEWEFDWLLTMDQDSIAAEGMVRSMLDLANRTPGLRCISPNIVVHGHLPEKLRAGPVAYAITSGNLVHLDVWKAAGSYNEEYFIDCIDFDFSLRARAKGFVIHKDPQALLHHELGQRVEIRRPLERFYTQHSPLRRYYMARNFLALARTHVLREPKFIGKLFVAHILLAVLMVFYEPQLKLNLHFIARGVLDFLRRRSSAYEPASR